MGNKCDILEIENSVINAIRDATYDPEAEINLSDSLINDLGVDSLEMQVVFSQLSCEYKGMAPLKNVLENIKDAIDSVDSYDGNYCRKVLENITNTAGLTFSKEDADDLQRRDLINVNKNLLVRYITEYITVKSLTDCISFLRGGRDG